MLQAGTTPCCCIDRAWLHLALSIRLYNIFIPVGSGPGRHKGWQAGLGLAGWARPGSWAGPGSQAGTGSSDNAKRNAHGQQSLPRPPRLRRGLGRVPAPAMKRGLATSPAPSQTKPTRNVLLLVVLNRDIFHRRWGSPGLGRSSFFRFRRHLKGL